MSTSNRLPGTNPLLTDLRNSLYLTQSGDVAIRTGITGNINITGPVTIPGTVTVDSSPENPVHVHVTESVAIALDSATLSALETTTVNQGTGGSSAWKVDIGTNGTVELGTTSLAALEHISIDNFPATQTVNGTVNIGTMPEVEIKNDSGNPISISKDSNANSSTNRIYVSQETDVVLADSNYELNVARGLVTGQYVEMKNGFASDLSQGVEATVWGQNVAYPWSSWTTAQKLYIISTSASDTGQTLFIDGLDANFNKITETVTTNGLTAVATSQNFLRINHCYLTTGATNVGVITERLASGTGTVVGSMAIGFSRNKGGFFTIPNGYTAYILYGEASSFHSGAGNISTAIKMYTRTNVNGTTTPFYNQYTGISVNGQFRNEFNVPLTVPAKTDIDVRLTPDGNNTTAACSWEMILIPN